MNIVPVPALSGSVSASTLRQGLLYPRLPWIHIAAHSPGPLLPVFSSTVLGAHICAIMPRVYSVRENPGLPARWASALPTKLYHCNYM